MPAAKSASAWRAPASAASSMIRMKAASVSWVAWARASWASVRATEVILPLRSHSAASAMVSGSSGMYGHLAFVEEAGDVVRRGRLPHGRALLRTDVHRRGAPGPEPTAARRVERARNLARAIYEDLIE